MSDFVIREAQTGDASLVSYFYFKLFEKQFDFLPGVEQYFLHAAAEIFDDMEGSRLWVLEEKGDIKGSICIVKKKDQEAQLRLFGTDPSLQGMGAGKALMQTAMDFCAQKGYTHILLWTIDICKAARHLYAKFGFEMTDTKLNTTWAAYSMTEELWEYDCVIRKAEEKDLDRIVQIYNAIHDGEEAGILSIGWKREVYPTRQTVIDAIGRGDLFVETEGDLVVAAAIINQIQVPEYEKCKWEYAADPQEVMVLHTLVVDPAWSGRGYAKKFVRYYEEYAKSHGCCCLRMDTQVRNTVARKLYAGLGYREAGIVESFFNGIPNVQLVCLERKISCGPRVGLPLKLHE